MLRVGMFFVRYMALEVFERQMVTNHMREQIEASIELERLTAELAPRGLDRFVEAPQPITPRIRASVTPA